MISIITSIYNQLPVNKLYYETLQACTSLPYELIIIDNNSDDGSCAYFEQKENVTLVKTGANYNYPYCQNLGIKHAKYDHLCFFNNDAIPTKHWDVRMFEVFQRNKKIKALSFATNDHLESKEAHKQISRKWKRAKYPLQAIFGNTYFSLTLMLKAMYGNLDTFGEKRFQKFGYETSEGYSGSVIVLKKDILEKIGMWDERIQAADFDLFNRIKEYALANEDIESLQLALGIYFHHYQRLTVKKEYPPFANVEQMIHLEDKWGERTQELRKDIIC